MRLVLPDARKSVEKYLEGEDGFELFRRRRERAMHRGVSYTRWECMRECFLSASQQQKVLGSETLAHQNAWDFETIERDLLRVGFSSVEQSAFQSSGQSAFSFEGCFESEANEDYRSLYVEATKS
ncbi:hypothetical protein DSM3645_28607 [Blastopirellula marina DSM 3645]|uniref:Uncharacterized protein n=2 Tax=Blastopirellula marina TaxID=124 RepID=A3ZPE3_9BACT|nr:hypothetical protein DSM3645_28607 [Blastopirellula marina DSM 3645]